MISDITQQQLNHLHVAPDKPLVICDVDEVIVHFIQDFEHYLGQRDLALTPAHPSQPYAIRHLASGDATTTAETHALVDQFFEIHTRSMKPIIGAVKGLKALGDHASIIMLTNLPHFAGDDRRENLKGFGLHFPVITNSGPKGPAISNLAARTSRPVAFIDDSPSFVQSAFEHAPHVHIVHFMHDERFSAFVPPLDFVSLRTNHWKHIEPHVLKLVAG